MRLGARENADQGILLAATTEHNGRSPHIFNCGFRRIKIQLGNASDIGARYERAEIDDATLHIRTDKFCSVGFYLDDITGK